MEYEDDVEVEVEWGDGTQEEHSRWSLVGKIISNRGINPGRVITLIKKAWNTDEPIHARVLQEGIYLFSFTTKKDYDRVLRDSP